MLKLTRRGPSYSSQGLLRVRKTSSRFTSGSVVEATAVMADQGFGSMANFLTGVIVARASTGEQYGIFVLCLTGLSFLVGIQSSAVSIPYAIHYPRVAREDRSVFLGSSLVGQFAISMCAVGLLTVVAAVLYVRGSAWSHVEALLVLVLTAFIWMMRDFVRAVLLAHLRVWDNLVMGTAGNVMTLGLLASAYLGHWITIPRVFFLMAMGNGTPIMAISILRLWRNSSVVSSRLWRDFLIHWEQGKWLVARSLLYFGVAPLYPFLIGLFRTNEQVAAYGVCLAMGSLVNPLVLGLGSYLRPKFCHTVAVHSQGLRSSMGRVLVIFGIGLALLLMVTARWGEALVRMVYGPQYEGLGVPLVLATVAVGLSVIETPFLLANEAHRNTKATLIGRLIAVLPAVTLGVWLVRCWGVTGALMGLSLSSAVSLTYVVVTYYHLSHPRRLDEPQDQVQQEPPRTRTLPSARYGSLGGVEE